MPAGRPSTYSPEIAEKLFERLAQGDLLVEITKEPGMPSIGAIHNWKGAHPEFAKGYARARELQAQSAAERAVISGRRATPEDAHAARVRFDADRWLAARLDPRNWGEKVQQQHSGTVTLESLVAAAHQKPDDEND